MTLRVLHLVGSATSPFLGDLSLLYARHCLAATADPARYAFHVAYVTPDRCWRFPADLSAAAIDRAVPERGAEAVRRLADLAPDVAVPQMFCVPGTTTYRGLLDLLGIPYPGNTPVTMALGADKALAKAVVAAAGVPTPPGEVLRAGQRPSISPPAVVKPVDGDNSVGVRLVDDAAGYPAALAEAFAHSGRVLVESYVPLGREVRCGVLDTGDGLVCLPPEEYAVDSATKPIRDYADKIAGDADAGLTLVAKESDRAWMVDGDDPVTGPVQDAARRCHVALGCRDYGLFDFRVDPQGQPWFLEAGLYCSFAPTSVISAMAAAAGIALADLFDSALHRAIGRAS